MKIKIKKGSSLDAFASRKTICDLLDDNNKWKYNLILEVENE